MDHQFIEAHNIVSRHLMGKLSARERAEFEEHFLDCPQCLDQLETEDDFRKALKRLEYAEPRISRSAPVDFLYSVTHLRPRRQAILFLTSALLLAAVPAAFLTGRANPSRERPNPSTAESQNWQRRYEVEREARAELEKRLDGAEKELRQRAKDSAGSGEGGQLPVVASVFNLETTRDAQADGAEPVNRFEIPSSPHWIVLSMERDDPDIRDYRATLVSADGRALWTKSRILPTRPEALALVVPASLFHAGNYILTLDGLAGERYVPLARYPLRITITR